MAKIKILLFSICFIFSALTTDAFARQSIPTACLVVDYKTNKVLYENNPNALVHPASLTKMMTLLLVFDRLQTGNLSLQKRFQVSAHAAAQAPSKIDLKPGQWISVNDLILAVVTRSANDAATVLAENIGNNEANFVAMMNQKAKALGMTNTVFYNPSGLPNPKQYTTAKDMVLLAEALIRTQPGYYRFFGTRSFIYNGQRVASHNHMLSWYQGADGIKTGYVSASGFNLVASAVRNNRRLIGVIFGSPNAKVRDRKMAQILDQCFQIPAN